MGCRRESPSSSVLDAFAFPSTIIGFKLDNLLISRLPPPGTRSNTFRHCACGPVHPTPLRLFDGKLSPSRPSKVGNEESAEATGPGSANVPLVPDKTEFVQRDRGWKWECLRT